MPSLRYRFRFKAMGHAREHFNSPDQYHDDGLRLDGPGSSSGASFDLGGGGGSDSSRQYDDEDKVCVDCGRTFVFREKDRKFCEANGWTPFKRCQDCRRKKKAQKEAAAAGM